MNEEKLREQVSLIERVVRESGLSFEELAEIVNVKPDTMRRLRKGYHLAGDSLLELIRRVPHLPSLKGRTNKKSGQAVVPQAQTESAEPVTVLDRFSFALTNATFSEQQIFIGAVEAAYRAITKRMREAEKAAATVPAASPKIIDITQGQKLTPLYGDIAAGFPQEAIEQAEQFVIVSAEIAKEVTYALRVRGVSMVDRGINDGDLVAMDDRREPKDNDVVAALIDGQMTLKTYVSRKGKVHLKSENGQHPQKFTPVDELTIQGVMVANLGPA